MSTNYIANSDDLESVADAIRAKTGGTSELEFPDEFVSEIGSLATGLTPLNSVTISISGDAVSWTSIDNAVCYAIYEGSTVLTYVLETSANIKSILQSKSYSSGTYQIKVKAIGDGSTYGPSTSGNVIPYYYDAIHDLEGTTWHFNDIITSYVNVELNVNCTVVVPSFTTYTTEKITYSSGSYIVFGIGMETRCGFSSGGVENWYCYYNGSWVTNRQAPTVTFNSGSTSDPTLVAYVKANATLVQ